MLFFLFIEEIQGFYFLPLVAEMCNILSRCPENAVSLFKNMPGSYLLSHILTCIPVLKRKDLIQ